MFDVASLDWAGTSTTSTDWTPHPRSHPSPLYSHNDVVDGDVNQFDEETDETHDGEPDRRGHGDFLEFWKNRERSSMLKSTTNQIKPITKKHKTCAASWLV